MIKNSKPLHPGQVLDEVYMKEMGLNQSQLAEKCKCSPRKINEIVNGKRAISPEFAIVLEKLWEQPLKCGCACRPIMIYGMPERVWLEQ